MQYRFLLIACVFFSISKQDVFSQTGFSHELGFAAGPVLFYSDYGQRNDFETNTGNIGFGVGLLHYMNFSYRADCNCYTRAKYFNDHFKVRNEIDYHVTNFQHFGDYVADDKTSEVSEYLRSIRGSTKIIQIGSQLEFYPLSIRDFAAGGYSFAPYFSAGVHYVNFNPESSRLDGRSPDVILPSTDPSVISDPTDRTVQKYIGAYQQSGDSTWSILGSVGVRYKLNTLSDILLDARWQYYFSDWVDGLNPRFENNNRVQVPENQANDWVYWISVGYVYYL